jgi:hypothetical protein
MTAARKSPRPPLRRRLQQLEESLRCLATVSLAQVPELEHRGQVLAVADRRATARTFGYVADRLHLHLTPWSVVPERKNPSPPP